MYLDIDVFDHVQLVSTSMAAPNMVAEARVIFGYTLAPHLSLFAGPTYNVLLATDVSRADMPDYATRDSRPSSAASGTSVSVWGWPGVAVGVEGL
jgi:hypothetical protein